MDWYLYDRDLRYEKVKKRLSIQRRIQDIQKLFFERRIFRISQKIIHWNHWKGDKFTYCFSI